MEYPISLLLMSWGGVIKCLYFIRCLDSGANRHMVFLILLRGYMKYSFCWVIDDTMIYRGSHVNFFPIAVVCWLKLMFFSFFYPFN